MEPINKLEDKIDRLDQRLDRMLEHKNELLNKVDSKLDKLDERLDNIDKTMIKQEANLDLHMRRSESLEKLVELQEKRVIPIEKHVIGVRFLFKVIMSTIATIGTVAAILESFNFLQ